MLLAQGRFWQIVLTKGADEVALSFLKDRLPDDLQELKELKIEVPLESWTRVVKQARIDRKLLGGIVLDFTKQKDQLSAAMGSDRLYGELQRVVLDATATLVENGLLILSSVDISAE